MGARWQAFTLAVIVSGGGALARADGDAAYWFALGQLLSAEGQVDEALEAFDRAIAAAPDEPVLRVERAEVLMRLGRLEQAAMEAAEAVRLAPEEPDALRARGRIEMIRSERDAAALRAAIDSFERLVELDRQDVEALASLGQLRLAEGNPALAVEPLTEALRLRPGQPTLEALLARALTASGRRAEAEVHQRALLEVHPRQLALRLELADELARQGRGGEAIDLLRQAPIDQLEMAEVRRRVAHQLYLEGDLDEAREIAVALVTQDSGSTGGRVLLGLIELATGHFDRAASWLEPIALAAPDNEQIGDLYLRAIESIGRADEALDLLARREAALRAAGRTEDAERARLERALLLAREERWKDLADLAAELRRSSAPALRDQGTLLLAESLAARDRTDEALAVLDDAGPDRPALLGRRIEILWEAGRHQEADEALEVLRREVPDGELRAAEVLQRRGDFDSSVPILEALRQQDGSSITIAYRLGSAYERVGRIEDAVRLLRDIVSRAPDFAPALNYLGYLWIDRDENLDEAVAMVRRAVRLDPDNGAYVDSLGWGYFRQGRFPDAVSLLERADRLVRGDPTVLEHLGDARRAVGDPAGAREAYERAVATGEASEDVTRKLENLGGDR